MEVVQDPLEKQISGVASLQEPVRRALYLLAVERREITRDAAALALGISRSLAAFHLDKLAEEDLLDVRYERLTGRRGPGAGRPSKLYRRSSREIQVNLPPRSYELAARILLQSLAADASPESLWALHSAARRFGETLGEEALTLAGTGTSTDVRLETAQSLLRAYGFEPAGQADGKVILNNCPFHALAQDYRSLVCGMNLSLMQGMLEALQTDGVSALLTPQPGRCCVSLSRDEKQEDGTCPPIDDNSNAIRTP